MTTGLLRTSAKRRNTLCSEPALHGNRLVATVEHPNVSLSPPGEESPEEFDSARLAQILDALSSPVRLDLLKALRTPRTLGEIRLQPRRGAGGDGRAMSRVVVRRHLEKLLEIGVVRTQAKVRNGRRVPHYVVNHRQTFALTEELRRLALLRTEQSVTDGTQPGPAPRTPVPAGASLTIVNGVYERRQFPLVAQEGQRWSIGRDASCEICLDYDPFVSLHHAQVVAEGGSHWIVDLPSSRNGTDLNWERIPKGAAQPLAAGDVVCVGRSTLVFRSR